MAFRSMIVLLAVVAAAVSPIDSPGRRFLSIRPQTVFAAEPAVGMLMVHVIDEAGQPLPARVHLRDAAGRYLFAAGQTTRQRAVYKGTQPVCGDWFYTEGSFRIDVGAGEAQIDIAHGPAYATVHDAIPIVPGQNTEKHHGSDASSPQAPSSWFRPRRVTSTRTAHRLLPTSTASCKAPDNSAELSHRLGGSDR